MTVKKELVEHVNQEVSDLGFVEDFSDPSLKWEDIDEGFIGCYMDTDQDVSTVIEQYFSALSKCVDVLVTQSVFGARTVESVTLVSGTQSIQNESKQFRPTYLTIKHDGNQEGELEITGYMVDSEPFIRLVWLPRVAAYIWSFAELTGSNQ